MYQVILFISGSEIFIILLVVLLLFGANKIPEIAKGLGKGFHEFKKATQDIKEEFNEHTSDIKKEMNSLKEDFKEYTDFENIDDSKSEEQTGKSKSEQETPKEEGKKKKKKQ